MTARDDTSGPRPITVTGGQRLTTYGAKRDVLNRLIARAGVAHPLDEVSDAYVDLRAWAVRAGHGIGAKDHAADR